MTKREKEEQNMLLAKAYKEGYNKARFEFSKDDGFITKEYFRGYDEAISHVKTFLNNVAPQAIRLTIKVKQRTLSLEDKSEGTAWKDVSLIEAMDSYITDVQRSYRQIVKKLGG